MSISLDKGKTLDERLRDVERNIAVNTSVLTSLQGSITWSLRFGVGILIAIGTVLHGVYIEPLEGRVEALEEEVKEIKQ